MRMTLTTQLECPIETVWMQVHRPALLEHIAWPLIRFTYRAPRTPPPRWVEGRYRVGMWSFGVLPLGGQWVGIEYPEGSSIADGKAVLRDNGSGTLIHKWDHWIFLEDIGNGRTRYTDRLDVEAGVLTPFVWLFARLFYGHRQRRWRTLVATRFTALASEE